MSDPPNNQDWFAEATKVRWSDLTETLVPYVAPFVALGVAIPVAIIVGSLWVGLACFVVIVAVFFFGFWKAHME